MHKTRTLFILGIWVAVLPYLGFPSFWKDIFFTLSGLGLALYGYMMHRDSKIGEKKTFDNFSENSGFTLNEKGDERKVI